MQGCNIAPAARGKDNSKLAKGYSYYTCKGGITQAYQNVLENLPSMINLLIKIGIMQKSKANNII